MDQLSKHINQAQQDVEQVHTSSKKISRRFYQIESVEFEPANTLVENQE
jgi:DNA recombination protein RmuC